MEVDGCTIHTLAAVCNTLPMDVLLGTDVAELDCLLRKVENQSRKDSLHGVGGNNTFQGKEGS